MSKITWWIVIILSIITFWVIRTYNAWEPKPINLTEFRNNVISQLRANQEPTNTLNDDDLWEVENAIQDIIDQVDEELDGNEMENSWEMEDSEADVDSWSMIVEDTIEDNNEGIQVEVDSDQNIIDEWNQEINIMNEWYVEYDLPSLDVDLAAGKKVALFFKANWCSSCGSLNEDIVANKSIIDDETKIFVVDYDSEKELKEKYKVTQQHTIVYIDQDKNEIKKLIWTPTLQDLLEWFSA